MDIWSKKKRSFVMSRIRSRDTCPERKIRSIVFQMGYRYRLHDKHLPGKPDIVFRKFKKVIFVHGCFWHLHKNCRDGTVPKSGHDKWKIKLERNVERDRLHSRVLRKEGWKVLVLWECDIEKRTEKVISNLKSFLLEK